MPPMDVDTARRLLDEEKERLLAALAAHEDPNIVAEEMPLAPEAVEQHHLEASRVFDREVDQSIVGHARSELEEIEAAYRRLEDGTYGRCETCDEPIVEERLRIRPATRFCRDHQEEAERAAGLPRSTGDPTSTGS